jgi:hypothetical protein
MNDDRRLDERIAGLVRSVETGVPPAVEGRIRAAAEASRPVTGIFARRRRPGWILTRRRAIILALVPGAAAAVALAAFLLVPALRKQPVPRISEIRTEFEIPDKNIKIVFFQRPDFKLTQEE